MTSPLLATKLFIPPPRPGLVPRPHLIQRLNSGLHGKLTLLSAPAGFGKTTMVTEWLAQLSVDNYQAAWLSLDTTDNDLSRFLQYLIAALQTIGPGIGTTAMALGQSPQPPPIDAVLTSLINDITAWKKRIVLVMDDYHLITTSPIHDAFTFLLDHLPSNLHLVIATRSDPPLPLARLRGQGLLSELRASDLRFTRDEAGQFIEQGIGRILTADQLSALATRTEGWIAGLQMAAVSLQSHSQNIDRGDSISDFIAAFTGSNRFILDYLVEEVLQSQPDIIQAFLVQTSIVDRLTGPLCDALTGRTDGQETLESLERANLFIVPLDDRRRWYRYHHLFADLLRNQLNKTLPDTIPALHRRASSWYEQEGLIPEAMEHAIQTEDYDRAAGLLESIVSPLLNESRPAALLRLMAKIPNAKIVTRPWLCIHGAWAYFITWQFDSMEPLLEAAESGLARIAKGQLAETYSDETKIQGRIAALRAFMAQGQGELELAAALSLEALQHLEEDDLQLRSLLEMNLGDISTIQGDLESAHQYLQNSVTAGQAAGNFFATLGAMSRLAKLESTQGRLPQAARTYRRAIQLGIQWGGGKPMPGTGRPHVGLARVVYEWNDLVAAEDQLTRGIRLCELCGEQLGVLGGTLTLARLRQAQGKVEAMEEALEQAEAIARRDAGSVYANRVSSWQARLTLANGDLVAASRWAETQESALVVPAMADFQFEESRLTLARVWIAQERFEEALKLLGVMLPDAESGGRVGSAIEIQVLTALIHQAQNILSQALISLEQALFLAEPGGYVRVFVDEGPPVARLLYEAARRDIAPQQTGRLLAAFSLEPASSSESQAEGIVEPLSERELEVLQLIAEGLSNQEVSQRLFISLATVKWHTSNIYSKLGVRNRTQAIVQARALGILSST